MNSVLSATPYRLDRFANGLLACLFLLIGLTVFMPAQAYHFPWDQGHDTTEPNQPDDPGPCEGGECENDPDNCDSQGSPVYLSTGHFIWQETDVQLKGRPTLAVTRTFNSHDPRVGPLGAGWSMSCDQGLVFNYKYTGGNTSDSFIPQYVRRLPNGKRYVYTEQDDGTFKAPGLFDVVTRLSNGKARLEERDGRYKIYNKDGNLQTEVDRNGNAIHYSYDDQGRLVQKADDHGRSLNYDYNTNGLITAIRDHTGREWQYDYDQDGELVAVTDPTGGVRRYDYTDYSPVGDGHTYAHLTRITDASGVVETSVTYDGTKVATYTEYENTFTYQYDPANNRTTKTDSQGSQWVFTYNETGQYTRIDAPLGRTVQYDRDDDSLVTRYVGPMGTEYHFTYDEYGNQLTRTDERGTVTTQYDDEGHPWPLSVQTRSGRTTTLAYDDQGNPLTVTDPAGEVTTLSWTENGDLAQTTNALGHQTQFTYNDHGLPLTATDALGRTTQYQYDARNNLIQIVNPAGETQSFQYDERDRLISATDGNGDTTTYAYDAAGRRTQVTAPNGESVQYDYDTFGRLNRRTFYDGTVTEYTYRSDNLLASITRPGGVVITHDYDDAKRLVQKSIGNEDTYSYAYNDRDQQVRAENNTGVVTLEYDAFGRKVSETVNGETTTYQYNAEDETTQLAGLGITQSQTYNVKGLLSQLDVDGTLYQYTYDALNRLTALDRNAANSSLSYDAANQLSQIDHGNGLRSHDYQYDPASRVSQWQGVADETRAFDYDDTGRLTDVQSPSHPESFSYDALGNRLNNNAQYDAANRLLEDDTHSYTYDINGNRIEKIDKTTGEVERYTYNNLDQLVSYQAYPNDDADTQPTVDYSYAYGPMGRRWSKQNNLGTEATEFYWSGTHLVGETRNGTERRYILEGLTPVGFVENGEAYHYLRDHLGTAHEVVGSSGTMVWQADYRAFGKMSNSVNTVENRLRFPGQYFDSETGLHYNLNRYFDPGSGRYTTDDPIGVKGGVNVYQYAANNPINIIDPFGLYTVAGGANFSFGWGAGATFGLNLVSDGNQNIGIQFVSGGGGDTPGASATGSIEYTTAETIYDLEGFGSQTAVDGGEVIVGEAGAMFGNGFSGGYAALGLGVGTPVGASGYVTDTTTLISFNYGGIVDFFSSLFGKDSKCQ
ncbi:RHS repeat-associated core domain-containing protein [Saccharospirillum salsuginis]|uniref:RHS repeat-associated core domain-containing protein n=1 Tax=Saccharospirillum salsuginis TaxID=418750 RepID=A0A918NGJ3_9GAMM|nr:RHS repeat-associated core domain-containing protein [Saccharospirillum salsuginis]GGX65926.1 hypothetical protein GCM10007392_36920 [Saccharospirillum salsuginis]